MHIPGVIMTRITYMHTQVITIIHCVQNITLNTHLVLLWPGFIIHKITLFKFVGYRRLKALWRDNSISIPGGDIALQWNWRHSSWWFIWWIVVNSIRRSSTFCIRALGIRVVVTKIFISVVIRIRQNLTTVAIVVVVEAAAIVQGISVRRNTLLLLAEVWPTLLTQAVFLPQISSCWGWIG